MIRALLFTLIFYINTALFLLLGSPLLLCPRRWAMAALKAHARTSLFWQRLIVGTRMEVRGLDRLPKGACLVAAKHQSAWDTFALLPLMRDPAVVMKAELAYIPLYGWFSRNFDDFVYLDRIAVDPTYRRLGIGKAFYDHVIKRFTGVFPHLLCEVNVRPRNEASLLFHHSIGFREVGQQDTDGGNKTVSLLALRLE